MSDPFVPSPAAQREGTTGDRDGDGPTGRIAGIGGGLVGFLVFVEFTSGVLQGYYIPLLTDIARHLGIHDADVNWLEAAQLMLSAIAVPILAKLGDLLRPPPDAAGLGRGHRGGHRRAGVRADFPVFLVAWAVQGVYAAWLPLQVALIWYRSRGLADPAAQTRRATGLIVAALQFGAIVGALAGGQVGSAFADQFWLVLLVPGFLVLGVCAVVALRVPESEDREAGTVDVTGAALLSVVLLVITGGLTFVRVNGAGELWPWLVTALGRAARRPVRAVRAGPRRSAGRLPGAPQPVDVAGAAHGGAVRRQRPRRAGAAVDVRPHRSRRVRLRPRAVDEPWCRSSSAATSSRCCSARASSPGSRQRTTPRTTLIGAATLAGTGYLLLVPFHGSLAQVLACDGRRRARVRRARGGAARRRGRRRSGRADRRGDRPDQHHQGPRAAASRRRPSPSPSPPARRVLVDGSEGTAGSLSGYLTVWIVCGVTALAAAVALVFVPRLAFSDAPDVADLRSVAPATDRPARRPREGARSWPRRPAAPPWRSPPAGWPASGRRRSTPEPGRPRRPGRRRRGRAAGRAGPHPDVSSRDRRGGRRRRLRALPRAAGRALPGDPPRARPGGARRRRPALPLAQRHRRAAAGPDGALRRRPGGRPGLVARPVLRADRGRLRPRPRRHRRQGRPRGGPRGGRVPGRGRVHPRPRRLPLVRQRRGGVRRRRPARRRDAHRARHPALGRPRRGRRRGQRRLPRRPRRRPPSSGWPRRACWTSS